MGSKSYSLKGFTAAKYADKLKRAKKLHLTGGGLGKLTDEQMSHIATKSKVLGRTILRNRVHSKEISASFKKQKLQNKVLRRAHETTGFETAVKEVGKAPIRGSFKGPQHATVATGPIHLRAADNLSEKVGDLKFSSSSYRIERGAMLGREGKKYVNDAGLRDYGIARKYGSLDRAARLNADVSGIHGETYSVKRAVAGQNPTRSVIETRNEASGFNRVARSKKAQASLRRIKAELSGKLKGVKPSPKRAASLVRRRALIKQLGRKAGLLGVATNVMALPNVIKTGKYYAKKTKKHGYLAGAATAAELSGVPRWMVKKALGVPDRRL